MRALVSVLKRESKFELRSPYDPTLLSFLKSLPNARWNKAGKFWACDATPAAAAKICRETPAEVQAENAVRELAASFVEGVSAPLSREQPPVRKTDLRRHQVAGYHFAMQRDAALLAHEMGCVDCETEVLTRGGWIRIDQWVDGVEVAQFYPDTGVAEFVVPTSYIKARCDEMIHFKTARGLDQMLSPEHRVLWFNERKNWRVNSAEEIESGVGTKTARVLTAFDLESGTRMDISDADLRLQVAVIADGHFPNRTRRCVMRLKKKRKIERIEKLLTTAGIEFRVRDEESTGFRIFNFVAPLRIKVFTSDFYRCSFHQRSIICEECLNWDGSAAKGNRGGCFFSRSRESADFIQFCYSSTGRRASLRVQSRDNGIDYVVVATGSGRSGNFVHFAVRNGNSKRVPTSDGYKYCFTVPAGFLVFRRNGYVFTSGNSGKSFTTVAVLNNRDCRAVLILCPVSVRGVWRREFAKWSAIDYEVIVLEKGTVAKKTKDAERLTMLAEAHGKPYVVVTNYESAREKTFREWAKSRKWDAVVADESHRAKAHDSSTSKSLAEIGKAAKFRLALSGTPMPHSPLDIFGQFRFLDAGIFGTSYTAFRAEYAITGSLGAYHVVGHRNLDKLGRLMSMLTHEVKMSDTEIELPPVTHIRRSCEIEDRTGYEDLKEEMIARVGDGTITAANALVKLLRLHQWTSGVIVDDDGVARITGTEKKNLLEDLLEDIPEDRPVVVFANFIRSLDTIREVVEKSGRKYGEISGRRKDLTATSEYPDDVDVLAVQYQAGGVGIDLTRANYAICYDHTFNMGNNDQAMARVHRPGQVHPTIIYHLVVEDTMDDVIVGSLEKKRDVVESVLEYLRCRMT